jgi:Na+-transporting NADH:ubiquinone oxidoreductase subunit NqrC
MQKKVTVVTIIIISFLVVAVIVGTILVVGNTYNKKAGELNNQIEMAQAEVDALRESKDTNGFTPTELVKAFFAEVKSDATDKAKLYLAPDVQDMDTKATLKLGSDLANVITGENMEEINGENADVIMTFVFADETTTVRTFSVSKYYGTWKINGVIAE